MIGTAEKKRKRHKYKGEDLIRVIETLERAKENKSDTKVVWMMLSDEIGIGEAALRWKITDTRKKATASGMGVIEYIREKYLTPEVDEKSVQPEFALPVPDPSSGVKSVEVKINYQEPVEMSVLDKVQKVVEERDMYKKLYEEAKSKLDAIEKLVTIK